MTTASKSNGLDKIELPGWGSEDWVKPGSCLAEVCGLEGHICGLMVVWELIKPSWCPIPNADSILRATQDVQRELNSDCNLRDLNII